MGDLAKIKEGQNSKPDDLAELVAHRNKKRQKRTIANKFIRTQTKQDDDSILHSRKLP
jgi:hypothetical protein